MSYRVCVLSNEDSQSHHLWVASLKKSDSVKSYNIVDITADNWLSLIENVSYDIFLLKPPGKTELFKRVYDERVLLISQYFDIQIYPSVNEVLVYENKRFLRDWLMINHLPHPETFVFFHFKKAKGFILENTVFPIVGKLNIGASGNGVKILKTKNEALEYVNRAFKDGIMPKIGPKLAKGSLLKKLKKATTKGFFKQRLTDYQKDFLNMQYHFVIFQKFIKHEWEWRCVRIGDSYFAHKKIVRGDMASGSLMKGYNDVPRKLLDFIKSVTDKHILTSVAIDVFESDENYYINEIQCFFGQSDPYQMLVDDKPGRYIYKDLKWNFEEGMFNTNESYDLRLKHALSMLRKI
jgi:glutathione synthase/RimK-type ligase-like ATP-grasp enzyme